MSTPKSMIHILRGRRVTSSPLIHGTITSELGRPWGLGAQSISKATASGMSKAPPFVSPMKDNPTFAASGLAVVVLAVERRLAWIAATGLLSKMRSACEPLSNPIMETWTFAPSRIQSRSLSAKKMSPVVLICSSTLRFAPPRMPCVASKPARAALAGLDLPPGLLEPVAAQVRLVWNPLAPDAEHGVHIVVAQVLPQELPAQERRVAHDELGLRPLGLLRMLRVGEVEDGVHTADALDRCQHRMVGHLESVVVHPLEIADPDYDLGKLLGVGVDFQSVKLCGIHLGNQRQSARGRVGNNLLLQVQEHVDRHVEEVAGAAGRIENGDWATRSMKSRIARSNALRCGESLAAALPVRDRLALTTLGHSSSSHRRLTSSHSRRNGASSTGTRRVSMSWRLV